MMENALTSLKGIAGSFSSDLSVQSIIRAIELFLHPLNQEAKGSKVTDKLNIIEKLILECVISEKNDKEMARHLNVPPSTVKYYVDRVVKKLNAENRKQIAMKT